jgi:hypothetical protein
MISETMTAVGLASPFPWQHRGAAVRCHAPPAPPLISSLSRGRRNNGI